MADPIPSPPAGAPDSPPASRMPALIQGFVKLPPSRQALLLVALAACIASVVGIVLWARAPDYSLLYGSLEERDAAQVVAALEKAAIPYRLDPATGAVRVPSTVVHEARLKLAAEGLPKGSGSGLEMLSQDPGFGVSRFMENARYQHAVEGELARTIGAMDGVEAVRVHLAIPERSVFVREHDKPSASVMVQMYRGRTLDDGQVAAIVHLVSSSVPNLPAARVTVVDQAGTLLTRPPGQEALNAPGAHYDYVRRLEQEYVRRVEDLLAAVVGPGGVRAKVSAEVDFAVTERTREEYQPDRTALRSEQLESTENVGTTPAIGVPGTLSNQPPPGASLAPAPGAQGAGGQGAAPGAAAGQGAAPGAQGAAAQGAAASTAAPLPSERTSRAVRNFEIDRTISHSKQAGGGVKRLTVAVVVDDRVVAGPDGKPQRQPRSQEELDRYAALVRDAVGYDAARGDSVNVVNAPFVPGEPSADSGRPPLWEQSWVWQAARLLLGAAALAAVLLGVLRPLLRSVRQAAAPVLAHTGPATTPALGQEGEVAGEPGSAPAAGPQRLAAPGEAAEAGTAPGTPAQEPAEPTMPELHVQDPQRVIQVLRNWMAADA